VPGFRQKQFVGFNHIPFNLGLFLLGKTPTEIRGEILKKAGGLANIGTAAELPSDKSIADTRSRMKHLEGYQETERLIARCSLEKNPASRFIRYISLGPSFLMMLATLTGLNDLERFCCVDGGAVMSVDTTYNMVLNCLVTFVTARHLMLTTVRSGVPPVRLCAAFLHILKDEETYARIAAMLLCSNRRLNRVRLIGTDGDKVSASKLSL
jgi:hypothetical protein